MCEKDVRMFYSIHVCVVLTPLLYCFCSQDLEGKIIVDELKPDVMTAGHGREPPICLSLAWSADGQTLFAGYSDKVIRVWQVSMAAR